MSKKTEIQSFQSQLDHKVRDWVHQQIINQEQAQNILNYENQNLTPNSSLKDSASVSSSWVLTGILILGAVVMGLGLISLVAANWDRISDAVKIITDFIILVTVSISIFVAKSKNKQILFESLIVFFMMVCLASIGLIGQVFNSGGTLYQALLFWSAITVCVMLWSEKMFASLLWGTLLTIGAMGEFLKTDLIDIYFGGYYVAAVYLMLMVLFAIYLILDFLVTRKKWLIGPLIKSYEIILIVFACGLMITIELERFFTSRVGDGISTFMLPHYLIAVIAVALLWLLSSKNKFEKVILTIGSVGILLYLHSLVFIEAEKAFHALATVLVLLLLCFLMALHRRKKLFDLFLFFVGLRALVFYFQALEGLATTGIGLLIFGVVIIILTISWNRYRQNLESWIERVLT